MYIYPDNLAAKATLWLWELKDLAIIGIGFLIGIFSLVRTGAAAAGACRRIRFSKHPL